jgi:hypothetical protein
MEALLEGRDHMKILLEARHGVEPFYEGLGFERAADAMIRRRRG